MASGQEAGNDSSCKSSKAPSGGGMIDPLIAIIPIFTALPTTKPAITANTFLIIGFIFRIQVLILEDLINFRELQVSVISKVREIYLHFQLILTCGSGI
jgi:hypothetical protein